MAEISQDDLIQPDNKVVSQATPFVVALGTLQPTAFSPLTLTSYSVEGVRPSRVVEKTSLATTCVSNEDAESEAA